MRFFLGKRALALQILFFVACMTLEDEGVDVDDILSPNGMPGTLLETIALNKNRDTMFNQSSSDFGITGRAPDGSLANALDTMMFHRSMMNEYLCRKYVANEILTEMSKNSFQRRMSDNAHEEEKLLSSEDIKKNIMQDQGSTAYEDWLKKSATLADIYRHHNDINKLNEEKPHLSKAEFENMDKSASVSTKYNHDYHGIPEVPDYIPYDGRHHVYETPAYFGHPTTYHHATYLEKNDNKKDKVGYIFEIALTALAYLSFVMFLVHLISSISAVLNNQTTTVPTRLVALNLGPAAMTADQYELVTEPIVESDDVRYRSMEPEKLVGTENPDANELAKKVLTIFDYALKAEEDNGQCLKNALCNTMQYSRSLKGNTNLFLAFLGFGASWLSEKISNGVVSNLESLQAVISGLGNANCENLYQICQLTHREEPSNHVNKSQIYVDHH